jgi:large subunit ribosomal protein L38
MRGTGWHRCVYVLFEHNKPIDFNLNVSKANQFEKRNFKVSEFFANHQKELTPIGLSFFQAEWDESVRNVFHNKLSKKFKM